MRFGALVFWVGFVGFMALSVLGTQSYLKATRDHGKTLIKATNQMGDLKQDMIKMRAQADALIGVDSRKTGTPSRGVNSGGVRKNAQNRIKELQKRQQGLRR